eukprot:8186390-Alexandrium_andersonii.AAC.1
MATMKAPRAAGEIRNQTSQTQTRARARSDIAVIVKALLCDQGPAIQSVGERNPTLNLDLAHARLLCPPTT